MKVKIGDKIYSTSENEPIMIILDEEDKINITKMKSGDCRYCVYPSEKYTPEEITKWMREGTEPDPDLSDAIDKLEEKDATDLSNDE